ncbi:ABC-three component system middle component 5 [Pseudomonas triticicola]|uniref:Integrase n=1 Tax=Pseudomonas triticicola TaxID=2842345 RepID=A0ABS6RFU6_9PSED|nr:ABC-three component system middle component 5 [Pseudomonas triticicola]MBV4545091.1 hypothetical protein [Pseudomonas triticicola]
MLIYHPAYDAYHCVFRMLSILSVIPSLEYDKARLLDFYLTFPSAVQTITLPKTLSHGKRTAKKFENIYHDPFDPFLIFKDMRAIQISAIGCLVASGIVDRSSYAEGIISRTNVKLPKSLETRISVFLESRPEIGDFILQDLAILPLRGINGLKHRTGLLEYKYDIS